MSIETVEGIERIFVKKTILTYDHRNSPRIIRVFSEENNIIPKNYV